MPSIQECNSTACVKVTHHFLQQMLEKKLKGCIVFTSSVSGYIPNPFAVMCKLFDLCVCYGGVHI